MIGVRPADEDRLPWLEPYRESQMRERPAAVRSVGGRKTLVTAAILLPVGLATGFWLGQRVDAPVQNAPPSATVPLPPAGSARNNTLAPSAPMPAEKAASAEPGTGEAESATSPPAAATASSPKPRKASRKRSASQKARRSATVGTAKADAVRKAQAQSRSWPKMPSPGPAGQVIQLGAFSTPARARNAYQARIARYPLLGQMPQVIVPVVTKPDGRVLYVLRLGTTSRQQSKTVCRNLQASGDHCLVIG